MVTEVSTQYTVISNGFRKGCSKASWAQSLVKPFVDCTTYGQPIACYGKTIQKG